MTKSVAINIILTCVFFFSAAAGEKQEALSFATAQGLEKQGKRKEAFVAYLKVPGAYDAAVGLARPKAEEYLKLLRTVGPEVPVIVRKTVEGELLLTMGRKAEALGCYREAVAQLGGKDDEKKVFGHEYVVYRPPPRPDYGPSSSTLIPFSVGPGSHRDNLLIRRFIALDAWDDAAKEFARMHDVHRRRIQPYVVNIPIYENKEIVRHEKRLYSPTGHDGKGLQFALDYAYFLKRRKKLDGALQVLLETLLSIDMDRNPNHTAPSKIVSPEAAEKFAERTNARRRSRISYFGGTAGVSRKEFIRLAYGAFKEAGRKERLEEVLRGKIAEGTNRLRRVLARIFTHQNKISDATKMELAYVANGNFDELSATVRRGLLYERSGQTKEAALAYEKALELPFSNPTLPEPDEEVDERTMLSSMSQIPLGAYGNGDRGWFHLDWLQRLKRLYGALGQTDKVLDVVLRQLELSAPNWSLPVLQSASEQFATAKKGEVFKAWLRKKLAVTKDWDARLIILEALGDKVAVQRINANERAEYLNTLRKRVAEHPEDKSAKLNLLNATGKGDSTEAMELSLDVSDWSRQVRRIPGDAQNESLMHLTYRLLRRFEMEETVEKMRTLGLRLAAGRKPFGKWWQADTSQFDYRDENDYPEYLNACLSLVVKHADAATIEALEGLWKDLPEFPAKKQLVRRKRGKLGSGNKRREFGWANLPEGTAAIASNQTILSLCRDETYVYSGHPWGVAVYTFKGEPVTRIALGTAALSLVAGDGAIWAGTPVGLNRIAVGTWDVRYLALDQDLPPKKRRADERPLQNGVCGLALDGDCLWIGTRRNVQRLHLRKMELEAFSRDELGVEFHSDWDRFLIEDRWVWANGGKGCRRYDRKSGSWAKVQYKRLPVHLIAVVEGTLFGHVNLGDPLRDRPCIIDRQTLEVTPVLIDSPKPRSINGPFSYFGTYHGKPVFGDDHPEYVYDSETGKLSSIGAPWDRPNDPIESVIPVGLRDGVVWETSDGVISCDSSRTDRFNVHGNRFVAGSWTLLTLPDGTRVLGGKPTYSPRYVYPSEDWPSAVEIHERAEGTGGLHFISQNGTMRHVSAENYTDAILGDTVFSVAPDDPGKRTWICTNHGLAVLDETGKVGANLTRSSGLCANHVTSGVAFAGKMWFSACWGDKAGGLAVYDPETSVFTSFFTADGLASDKLARLEVEKGALRLVYGIEYVRYGYRSGSSQQHPPGLFNPATRAVTSGGRAKEAVRANAPEWPSKDWRKPPASMPCLGGFLLAKRQYKGKTFLCGTRGLLVINGSEFPNPIVTRLAARFVPSQRQRLLDDARARRVRVKSPAELAAALKDENPFYRANAMASLMRVKDRDWALCLPLVASQLNDPNLRVRCTATYLLVKASSAEGVLPLLRKRLLDSDRYVRTLAAISLAESGELPAMKFLRPAVEENFGNFPFGAESSIGVVVGSDRFCRAVAPHATPEVFGLLMEYPPYLSRENKKNVFPALGAALRRQPKVAHTLLQAYDNRRTGPVKRDFARFVFKFAGASMLPTLHDALSSEDRVVRSNAARACGTIGNPSSIPILLKAMDLESGLSRASVVWALGELKAKEALPTLTKLYVDVRNDDKRRAGAGYRFSQSLAATQAQYESFRNLDAIGSDWNEMKEAALPEPIDPQRNEDLLTSEHIVEAVRKIGPQWSQSFYRMLAADEYENARLEAAVELVHCDKQEKAKNMAILKNLLADKQRQDVRTAAAVSLLIMGDKTVHRQILSWLSAEKPHIKRAICEQLTRVTDARLLVFARQKLIELQDDPQVKGRNYTWRGISNWLEDITRDLKAIPTQTPKSPH